MKDIAIGLDFGTLSVRGIILDLNNGEVIATSESEYRHGVIDEMIPDTSVHLFPDWALQHPDDYLESMNKVLSDLSLRIKEGDLFLQSIGVDFTSCTIIPVDQNNNPIMKNKHYYNRPHAWPKLWKHHAAQDQANRINALAKEENENWLKYYGNNISSEWLLPKVLQVLEEDEEIYNQTYSFMEAGDWIIYQLTGQEKRSITMAGFKGLYIDESFPDQNFLKKINPKLENFYDKQPSRYHNPTEKAGLLEKKYMDVLEVNYEVVVSVANIDAHAAIGSIPEHPKNIMVSSVGTSSCDIVLSEDCIVQKGISGIVNDGVLKDYCAYETGQSAVGDIFSWYIDHYINEEYYSKAQKENKNIFEYLESLIKDLGPGESGLIALDWFNGNRTPFMNTNYSALIFGLTLDTTPELIYHALIEATAFGKKKTLDLYESAGIKINKIYFTGGIPTKNSTFNQIYADVLNKEIVISEYPDNAAVGSAIFSSIASGYFDNMEEATKILKPHHQVVEPNTKNVVKYIEIYEDYDYITEALSRSVMMEKMNKRRVS